MEGKIYHVGKMIITFRYAQFQPGVFSALKKLLLPLFSTFCVVTTEKIFKWRITHQGGF